MIKQIIQTIVKILNIFFIALSFVLIFIAIFKKEWFELFIEWMKVKIVLLGYYNYFIVFFSSFTEAFPLIGAVIPGQNILLIVGGFFAEISYQNLIFVIIITSFGAILGNYVGYELGKRYGEHFFEKYGLWIGIGKTEVKYLKKGIEKWGALGITLGKFHGITRSFLPFIAGSAGMKNKAFMLYNTIGSIIRSTFMVVFGVVFAQYYKTILQHSGKIAIVILTLLILYVYFYKKEAVIKYYQEKNTEIDEYYKK